MKILVYICTTKFVLSTKKIYDMEKMTSKRLKTFEFNSNAQKQN